MNFQGRRSRGAEAHWEFITMKSGSGVPAVPPFRFTVKMAIAGILSIAL
jgi:hypothetical protein